MSVSKREKRAKIKVRVSKKIRGTQDRPRLSVFRSNKQIYAQIIDDESGTTLCATSSYAKGFKSDSKTDQAEKVGKNIAEIALSKGVETVVFDRNGYLYHGRVKALANAAREGGLKF